MRKIWIWYGVLIFCAVALEQSIAGAEGVGSSSATQYRRNYPGAKDDSDLSVQTLRPITRKGEDLEVEDFSSVEPTEEDTNAPPTQGFGE